MTSLKQLLKELKSADPSEMNQIRVELSVQGYFTFDEAVDLAKTYIPLDSLPDGVEVNKLVRYKTYLSGISAEIEEIETEKIFAGRNGSI